MSNLTILNTAVRQSNNLYSLTDLHTISGAENKHAPFRFMRNEQTQELIAEINAQTPNLVSSHKIIKGGSDLTIRGYWVCEELALAYAMWISPKFHLVVLRAFIAMHRGEVQNPQPIAPPKPVERSYIEKLTAKEIHNLVWLWYSQVQMNELLGHLVDPLDKIGSRFSPTVYSHHHEYKRQYQQTLPTLRRLVQHLKNDNPLEWERLHYRLDQVK